jgi:hypothetical protein
MGDTKTQTAWRSHKPILGKWANNTLQQTEVRLSKLRNSVSS